MTRKKNPFFHCVVSKWPGNAFLRSRVATVDSAVLNGKLAANPNRKCNQIPLSKRGSLTNLYTQTKLLFLALSFNIAEASDTKQTQNSSSGCGKSKSDSSLEIRSCCSTLLLKWDQWLDFGVILNRSEVQISQAHGFY